MQSQRADQPADMRDSDEALRHIERLSERPRIAVLLDHHQRGRPTACGYIRLILPLTGADVEARFNVRFLNLGELEAFAPDIVVVQRLAVSTPQDVNRLLEAVRNTGSRLVYEIDDDLFGIGRDHHEYEFFKELAPLLRKVMLEADEVWVSTQTLADELRLGATRCVVLQNELDTRLWTPPAEVTPGDEISFLYMGSASHGHDFKSVLLPAFQRLRRKLGKRVELTLIGVLDGSLQLKGINAMVPPSGVGASYPAFAGWLQSLRGFDIGLAPLADTHFNRSKSHIKWLEYAGMGMPTIASAWGEYRESIEPGVNGYLVAPDDADGFYQTMLELCLDPEKRRALSRGACALARRQIEMPGVKEKRLDRLAALAVQTVSGTALS